MAGKGAVPNLRDPDACQRREHFGIGLEVPSDQIHFQTNSHLSEIRDRVGITLENELQFPSQSIGFNRVGIQALSQAISHGAMRDSVDRDPPRCHPGTREKVIQDILCWIEERNLSSTVLWVNGRAGAGKLALMQKIAGLGLGESFFFRQDVPGCNVKGYLLCTLIYQLAMNVDDMFEAVDRAVMQDLSLMSATIQLKRLIIEPIRHLPIPLRSFIIIIDGLDECEDFNWHRDILTLIPEHQICDMLEPWTRRLVLDEGYATDIKRYLDDRFEEIYSRSGDIMPDIENPWPTKDDLDWLIWKASRLFIYASTVIKFIGSDPDLRIPEERLNIILKPSPIQDPIQDSAFSGLGRLYTQILSDLSKSAYPSPDSKDLLRILVFLVNPSAMIATIRLGEATLTASKNDLVFKNEHHCMVKFRHASLRDFLTDKAWSVPPEEPLSSVTTCLALDDACDPVVRTPKKLSIGTLDNNSLPFLPTLPGTISDGSDGESYRAIAFSSI